MRACNAAAALIPPRCTSLREAPLHPHPHLHACTGTGTGSTRAAPSAVSGRHIWASSALAGTSSCPACLAGVLVGCEDSEALCVIQNPLPSPERDYRNRSRTLVSSRGVVASDQSRCGDIGAAVLQVTLGGGEGRPLCAYLPRQRTEASTQAC